MGNEHWIETTIGSIAQYINGKAFKPSEWSNSGIPIIRIQNLNNDQSQFNYCNFDVPKKYYVNKGDLLFAWSGTPGTSFGAHIWKGTKAVLNQHIFRVVLNHNLIDKNFLMHLINNNINDYIAAAHGTAGLAHITKKNFEKSCIFIPSLGEQKRIAEKLDSILPKVKSINARLEKIPRILKRFRQSILASACSGKLTENWREENHDCEEWKSVFLKDVALSRLGKMLDQSKNRGNPTPYLRNTNVRWFDFNLRDVCTMKTTKEELPELWIKKGDVLICEGGEPGRCAIWLGADNSYIFQKALHRVRVGDTLLGKWLCFNIRDAANSGRLEDFFTGTTIKHLTGVMLKKFDFSLPPIKEQQEIVRRVEKLFKLADLLEAKYDKAMERVEKIEQSVLAKAFRGELAPQNPNDEPAEELLKRILAEKAKLQTAKKKSLRSLPEGMAKPRGEINPCKSV